MPTVTSNTIQQEPLPVLELIGIPGIPNIQPGDDLPRIILDAMAQAGLTLIDGDVLAVTQKIVSKAEDCLVDLRTLEPSPRALELAEAVSKDPQHVELLLRESKSIVRQRPGVLILETLHGWICANAGVDRSNVSGPAGEIALTLPEDADASARAIRDGVRAETGAEVTVIITDSHGRPWRKGTVNLAIGCAGMEPLLDFRGKHDMFGYELKVTVMARADELAAAAGLVSGQAAEGLPVVLIRGASFTVGESPATSMQRDAERDLFR